MPEVKTWVQAARLYAAPASVLPVLLGTACAAPIGEWKWAILIAEVLAVLAIHTGGNILNDYFDKLSGVDGPPENEPPEYAYRAKLTARQIGGEGIGFLAFALIPGAYLVWKGGAVALGLGACGMLAAYLYTGKPFHLKYRALGDPLIFLSFGVLPTLGAAYMQVGHFPREAFITSVPAALLIVAILHGNNIRDLATDGASGIRTLAHLIGYGPSRIYYALLIVIPTLLVCGLVVAGSLGLWCLGVLVAAPVGFKLISSGFKPGRVEKIDVMTAQYMGMFSTLFLLGLTIGGWR
ncbi:MAG TPA: prenyltransferase [Candidatus Brocadiia bacterium]|nr:prenyltransferase [Candidatus Brocadiia bacterium]